MPDTTTHSIASNVPNCITGKVQSIRDECRIRNSTNPSLRIVAVATSERDELTRLRQSAEALGFNLDVLGLDQTWEGLGSKITFLNDYLEDIPCDDIVLFLGTI